MTANRCTASKGHLMYPLWIFFSSSLHFAMKYLNVPDPLLCGELKTLHSVLKQKPVTFHVNSLFFKNKKYK